MTEYKFVRQNEEPIEIECVEDEHEEANDFKPSFWWENKRHYLEDYIRVHNNPWIGMTNDYPDYIHGRQEDGSPQSYENPLYVEISESGDCLNIYKEVAL